MRLGQAVLVFSPRDSWTDSAPPTPVEPAAPITVVWQPRDEPMAPSFDWPTRRARPLWPLYLLAGLGMVALIWYTMTHLIRVG
jgi:hypothetical protein